ncbi:MAG: LuxR C-terminal-related transcriptional regulator [Rubrobacteraceae bacterium]
MLGAKENEVLDLTVRGCSTRQISPLLFVCGYTVQDHLKDFFGRFSVHSRRDLVTVLSLNHPRNTHQVRAVGNRDGRSRLRPRPEIGGQTPPPRQLPPLSRPA